MHHNDLINQSLVASIARESDYRREQILANRGRRTTRARRLVSWREW